MRKTIKAEIAPATKPRHGKTVALVMPVRLNLDRPADINGNPLPQAEEKTFGMNADYVVRALNAFDVENLEMYFDHPHRALVFTESRP